MEQQKCKRSLLPEPYNKQPFLKLFEKIDSLLKNGRCIVAIDGGSASGKTHLSSILKSKYDCTVFHMDDFFLRPEQRTKKRLAEVGGNVDRERFLEEVLIPLSKNQTVTYRKFNCSKMELSPNESVSPKLLTVIEGAYSMHSELRGYYDLSVFLEISPDLQRERILKRNTPKMAERFFNEWIPLENTYFSKMNIKEICDIVISN